MQQKKKEKKRKKTPMSPRKERKEGTYPSLVALAKCGSPELATEVHAPLNS